MSGESGSSPDAGSISNFQIFTPTPADLLSFKKSETVLWTIAKILLLLLFQQPCMALAKFRQALDILLGSLIPTTLFGTCANPPAAETITPSVSKCLLGHVKKPFGGIRKEDLETRGNSYLKIVDDNTRTLPS